MASKRLRPTPPPSGPALIRPALGALLLTLSGAACGSDDGNGSDSANDSQPPMPGDEGPMPNPTDSLTSGNDTVPPMPDPSATAGDTSASESTTEIAPMPPPDTTSDTGDTSGSGSESGTTGPVPPMPPPMPPPDGGAAPEDDQEI